MCLDWFMLLCKTENIHNEIDKKTYWIPNIIHFKIQNPSWKFEQIGKIDCLIHVSSMRLCASGIGVLPSDDIERVALHWQIYRHALNSTAPISTC